VSWKTLRKKGGISSLISVRLFLGLLLDDQELVAVDDQRREQSVEQQ
jgi:hypothetical protein